MASLASSVSSLPSGPSVPSGPSTIVSVNEVHAAPLVIPPHSTAHVQFADWDTVPFYHCLDPTVEHVATLWVSYTTEALKSRYRNDMPMFLWVQYSSERGYAFQGQFFPTIREAMESAVDLVDRFTHRGLRDVCDAIHTAVVTHPIQ